MKIPTPGRGSAAKRHCNDAEECEDQVKAALTPITRRTRQADEVADSRQAPKGATVVPAILRGAAKSRRRRAFGEHAEGLTAWLSSTIVRAMNGLTHICGICRGIIR
jgi:hypothetical protein